jgi:hypothetical protein
MIKSQNVNAAHKFPELVEITIVTHSCGRETSRGTRGFGEHAKFEAEVDGRGNHHASELTASHHTDNCHVFSLLPEVFDI